MERKKERKKGQMEGRKRRQEGKKEIKKGRKDGRTEGRKEGRKKVRKEGKMEGRKGGRDVRKQSGPDWRKTVFRTKSRCSPTSLMLFFFFLHLLSIHRLSFIDVSVQPWRSVIM